MSVLKKVSAVSLCAAMALSLAACSLGGPDTSYGAEIDGYKVPAGIFISMQVDAYYDSMSQTDQSGEPAVTEASGEETVTTVTTPFTNRTVNGQPVRDWINDEATKSMQEYVAVENKFDELGLSFQDGEKEKTTIYLNSFWESYGSMYEKWGISENSQILRSLNSQKRRLIFDFYYGKGGKNEVSEEEIKKYLTENNARINYIEMQLRDGEGNLLKSEGKEERKKMADDYIARAEAGEDFNAILKEYNDYYKKLQEDANSANISIGAADSDEDPDNTMIVSKGGMYPFADVIEKVWSGEAKTGNVYFVESTNGETYYIVKILDLFEDGEYYGNNESAALHAIKDDEFNAEVESWTASQNVIRNEAAYKRYKLEKFMD